MAEGIEVRHARTCRSVKVKGARCNCAPTYRASVWSNRDQKRIRKVFTSMAEAKTWRGDAHSQVAKGTLIAPKPTTVKQAWEEWHELAKAGVVRNRAGDEYKPSAIRQYKCYADGHIIPAMGATKLTELRRVQVQDLVDKLVADGYSASTAQCSLLPLRAIYRRAMQRGDVAINPCAGVSVPAIRSKPKRIADPSEVAKLIAALPKEDRPLWSTAFYAGLRRGELKALKWSNVDLATGVIHVEKGWDSIEGEIAPKSRQGRRRVPISAVLRDVLVEHRMNTEGDGLVFGRTASEPFAEASIYKRAHKAWTDAKLDRVTLHEARHGFASFMIAAGVNLKALSTYMGHHSIRISLDLYGHLMPGNEDEAAGLLDAFFARADTAARLAQVESA